MKVSRNWLKTFFDNDIPSADGLVNLFTFHSFEVEGVEKIDGDDVLDIKVLPDRAHYCLSHAGVASEVSVLTKLALKKDRIPAEVSLGTDIAPKIVVQDPKFCRRYMARYVEGISVGETPEWIRNFLAVIGERSINPIVDAANINMFDIGQPMHVFDADKIVGNLSVRPAKEGEKITLLDGRELVLDKNDNVIADDEGALVVAGAKGGKRAEVTSSTKRILIESANFDPVVVRRTSNKYDIRSESSKRYENEITPELASVGMNNISALIREICPEAKFGPIIDMYPTKPSQNKISFDPAYVENRLGISIPTEDIEAILVSMDIRITKNPTLWDLVIPYSRFDLVSKEDIVEEVGRVYGYDKIGGVLPPINSPKTPVLPEYYLSERIRNILVEAGFSEVNLYSLVSSGVVETAHPLAMDKSFVRANLTDGMMSCLEKNIINADLLGLDAIRIFEIGHVFLDNEEKIFLSVGVGQVKKSKEHKPTRMLDEAITRITESLGIEIPKVNKIENSTKVACEIDLDLIVKAYHEAIPDDVSSLKLGQISNNHYKRYSQFPFVVRDVAFFASLDVEQAEVKSIIDNLANEMSKGLIVRGPIQFDYFVKGDKASHAYRMIFQSMDRTLTDDEVNMIMLDIHKGLEDKGLEVR